MKLPHCDPTFSIAFLLSRLLQLYRCGGNNYNTQSCFTCCCAFTQFFCSFSCCCCCFCSCYCSHCAISTTVRGCASVYTVCTCLVLFVELFLGKALQKRKKSLCLCIEQRTTRHLDTLNSIKVVCCRWQLQTRSRIVQSPHTHTPTVDNNFLFATLCRRRPFQIEIEKFWTFIGLAFCNCQKLVQ